MRISTGLAVIASLTAFPVQVAAQTVPDDLLITLERKPGGGQSPMYSVTIDARGLVTYSGKSFVRVEGEAVDRIPVSQVRNLVATIDRIDFFNLQDRYVYLARPDGLQVYVTHRPTAFVTVTRNGLTKRVEDYNGAPAGLRELELQVDDVVRTRRWVRIDVATLQQMVEAGRAPGAREQGRLLRRAIYADDVDVIQALLDLGADPNELPSDEHDGSTQPLFLVRSGAAAQALVRAGANPRAVDDFGRTAMWNAVGVQPDVAEVLLKAGVPVDAPIDVDGATALPLAARAGNVVVVKLLLAAGASPSTRAYGRTALELAVEQREHERRNRLVTTSPPFVEDFDGVISALEAAVAARLR